MIKNFTKILILGLFFAMPSLAEDISTSVIDSGNTSWLLISSALVMLMTPGLGFFYAGLVNHKNVVSTLLQNYVSLAVIALLWVIIGFTLVFDKGNGFIGGLGFFMLNGLEGKLYSDIKVPYYAFVSFQMMFAIIAPALITGSFAERVNFKAWILMLIMWSLFVYVPVAHWVWGPEGWLSKDGALDFAGGIVVHLTAGISALVSAIVFGPRIASVSKNSKPSDITMVMLGGALLWFGWFGFNAGSSMISGHVASQAFLVTHIGASAAFISWLIVDWIIHKKPKAVGATVGFVVGLVTITPAAGYVSVESAIIMCSISAAICNLSARFLKSKTNLDDSLDVFACHGIGGALGAIMTGLYAQTSINSAVTVQGFLISGETSLFVANFEGVIIVAIFVAIATYTIINLVNFITPIRASTKAEQEGLDIGIHGEEYRSDDK